MRLSFKILGHFSRLQPYINTILYLILATSVYFLAVQHWNIIHFKYPLEYRENTELYRTLLAAHGHNLYDGSTFPAGHSQYGFIYNYICVPFLKTFGEGFTALRATSAIFNVLSALALALYARHKACGLSICIAIFAWAYASTFTHTSIFLSYPVGLGGFFFLVSVLLPVAFKFSRWSLVFAQVCGLLGFLCKLYFGFGPAFILAYLFFKRRWLTAIQFTFAGVLLFSIGLFVISLFFPFYFSTTVKLSSVLPNWNGLYLIKQIAYFGLLFFPALSSIVLTYLIFSKKEKGVFLTSFGFISSLVSMIILLKMGGNQGAHYLYFHNMLFPFFGIMLVDMASFSTSSQCRVLVGLIASTFVFLFVSTLHAPLGQVASGFEKLERLMKGKRPLLADPPASFFQIVDGETPDDPGQVEYLAFTEGLPRNLYDLQRSKEAKAKASQYFGLVLTDDFQVDKQNEILNRCYINVGNVQLLMYRESVAVSAWSPRSMCVDGNPSAKATSLPND